MIELEKFLDLESAYVHFQPFKVTPSVRKGVKSKSAEYSKKCREKKRAIEKLLREENVFYENEICLLKRKVSSLKVEVNRIVSTLDQDGIENFRRVRKRLVEENKVLRNELAILKKARKSCIDFVQSFDLSHLLSTMNLNIGKNFDFLLNETLSFVNDKDILNQLSYGVSACPEVKQRIEAALQVVRDQENIDERLKCFLLEQDILDFKCSNLQIRSNIESAEHRYYSRIDITDLVVSKKNLLEILKSLEELKLSELFLGLFMKNEDENVAKEAGRIRAVNVNTTLKKDMSLYAIDDEQEKEGFYINFRCKQNLQDKSFPESNSMFSNIDADLTMYGLIPRKESCLGELKSVGFLLLDSVVVREGSSPSKSHITLLTRFNIPEDIGEIDYKKSSLPTDIATDAKRMEELTILEMMKKSDYQLKEEMALVWFILNCWVYLNGKIPKSRAH